MPGNQIYNELRVFIAEWPVNPFFNIAFEEAVFLEARSPYLRFWRNDKAVVIGAFQCSVLEVNAHVAVQHGIKLTRRFTGGGAVYHDLGNINYALTLPGYELGLEDAFKLVGESVATALRELGVNAYYRPLNDIEVDGLKISGMAASRRHDRVFVHGSLLVSSDLSILQSVLKISGEKVSDKKYVKSRTKRVATLREVLGKKVDIDTLYNLIASNIARKLGMSYKRVDIDIPFLKTAIKLYRTKYSSAKWNLGCLDEFIDMLSKEEINSFIEIATPDERQEEVVKDMERCLG
ncbi:MAG: lipoate--protein ligase family protein [Desulfurococcaceae archaeon]